MKVTKWGDQLAVCLPGPVVEALSLRKGDEVEVVAAGEVVEVSRDRRREEALARIRAMRVPLPPGYEFDRDDAHGRNGFRPDPDMVDER